MLHRVSFNRVFVSGVPWAVNVAKMYWEEDVTQGETETARNSLVSSLYGDCDLSDVVDRVRDRRNCWEFLRSTVCVEMVTCLLLFCPMMHW